MDALQYNYLKFVRFMEVQEWSVQFLQESNIKYNNAYPLVPIGKFLSRNKTQIEVQDDVKYKRPTIKTNNGGICLRDIKVGNEIGTKNQFLIKEGQFLLSKIDARNGAFGVVPHDCDKGIITGNFWTFDVDYSQVNPFFLSLVTTTKAFINFAERASNGTTNRHYLQEDKFLKEKIPLPSIEEQNALVSAYEAQINQAETLKKQATNIEANIEKYLLDTLGIEQTTTKKHDNKNGFLQMVRFKNMERWDVWNNTQALNSSKFSIIKLGDIINDIATGTTPPTSQKEYFNGNIKFYTPADISNSMYLGKSERYISQKAVDANKARLFFKDYILFVGIGSTVGKVGIVSDKVVSSNQQITGFSINCKSASPEYIFCFMNYNKDLTTMERSKTTLPIVNQEKIRNIPIPLPDKPIQDEIVAHINSEKEEIKNKKAEAEKLRNEALSKFEKSIFE
jgi:type I restriction enzyme S subunit